MVGEISCMSKNYFVLMYVMETLRGLRVISSSEYIKIDQEFIRRMMRE